MRMTMRHIAFLILLFACSVVLTGCFGRTKPPYAVDQYTLDYTSPKAPQREGPVNELLTVERFSIAPHFNSTSMIIRTGQYRFDTYDYSRWYVNPADMVTGFVLRDITRSGMFTGTYSYYDTELSRYILEGYIEEFGETTDGKALASIRFTLVDTSQQSPVGQIVFQKQYVQLSPIGDRSANGLAAALSAATQELSARLIADIGIAVRAKKAN